MSSSSPTHADVLAADGAHRQASPATGSDRSNPSAADAGTTHLFGARGPIDSAAVPTVPHTVSSGPLSQQGSGIADVVEQEQNAPGMTIGTHAHTHGVSDVTRARREGSAS